MEDTLAALSHLPVRRETLSLPVSPLPEIRLHPSADGVAVLCRALPFLLLLAAAGCVHGPTHCCLRDSRQMGMKPVHIPATPSKSESLFVLRNRKVCLSPQGPLLLSEALCPDSCYSGFVRKGVLSLRDPTMSVCDYAANFSKCFPTSGLDHGGSGS